MHRNAKITKHSPESKKEQVKHIQWQYIGKNTQICHNHEEQPSLGHQNKERWGIFNGQNIGEVIQECNNHKAQPSSRGIIRRRAEAHSMAKYRCRDARLPQLRSKGFPRHQIRRDEAHSMAKYRWRYTGMPKSWSTAFLGHQKKRIWETNNDVQTSCMKPPKHKERTIATEKPLWNR